MLRTAHATVILWLMVASEAIAQATTVPGTPAPAQPAVTAQSADSGGNILWLIIVAALIAAAVWYFIRRRGATRL